jgi:hypothetical protein
METSEALRIIESLAHSVDPLTGEVFPDKSPYQHPQTLRALFMAVRALERLEARQKREHRLPENAGKTWNPTEDHQLCASFDAGTTIQQLAQQHKRTEGAIHSRLVKLGKMPPPTQVSPPTPSL